MSRRRSIPGMKVGRKPDLSTRLYTEDGKRDFKNEEQRRRDLKNKDKKKINLLPEALKS